MRYLIGLFWSFVLSNMFVYVISSMAGGAYDFKLGATLSVVFFAGVLLVSSTIPNEPVEQHHH